MHELGFIPGLLLMYLQPAPTDLPGWPLELITQRFSANHHGDFARWAQALDDLPPLQNPVAQYDATVTVSGATDNTLLHAALQGLHPWRKGPYQIGQTFINCEWRSDWKWDRLAPALGDLHNERILDIGCGNGYFGWRMLDRGAREVIGIDPTLLFCMQHQAIRRYTQDDRNWVLPFKVEELPDTVQFDSVFSMGVIYHRRDPRQHVNQLAGLTRPGGRVVLESLVVSGTKDLIPQGRYARMRNVWCVPCTSSLRHHLEAAGFVDVDVVDISPTSFDEQRSTQWMRFESLREAIDPKDPNRTIEGYPAPQRALLLARKPADPNA